MARISSIGPQSFSYSPCSTHVQDQCSLYSDPFSCNQGGICKFQPQYGSTGIYQGVCQPVQDFCYGLPPSTCQSTAECLVRATATSTPLSLVLCFFRFPHSHIALPLLYSSSPAALRTSVAPSRPVARWTRTRAVTTRRALLTTHVSLPMTTVPTASARPTARS